MAWTMGTDKVDFTPPTGTRMAAFPRGPQRTPRRCEGANDRLHARAWVLEQDGDAVALLSVEACMLRAPTIDRVRAVVSSAVPALDASRIILTATHTHSGPETSFLFGGTPDDAWLPHFHEQMAEAAIRAWGERVPVRCRVGRVDAPLNHNRRVKDPGGKIILHHEFASGVTTGPCDPEMIVLRFDDVDGRPRGIWVNYAAHPVTVGPPNNLLSGDWPGLVSRRLEAVWPGAVAGCLQGGAGDLHPHRCMRADFSAMEDMGTQLSACAMKAMDAARTVEPGPIKVAVRTLTFPNRADECLTKPVELTALGLGEVVLGFMPGEPFVAFQQAFKAKAPGMPLLVGYAHDWVGYVPTRASYEEGGYGVDFFPADPPPWSRTALPPGAGETMLDALLMLAVDCAHKDS